MENDKNSNMFDCIFPLIDKFIVFIILLIIACVKWFGISLPFYGFFVIIFTVSGDKMIKDERNI